MMAHHPAKELPHIYRHMIPNLYGIEKDIIKHRPRHNHGPCKRESLVDCGYIIVILTKLRISSDRIYVDGQSFINLRKIYLLFGELIDLSHCMTFHHGWWRLSWNIIQSLDRCVFAHWMKLWEGSLLMIVTVFKRSQELFVHELVSYINYLLRCLTLCPQQYIQ